MILGVSVVRNEADIIETMVRQNLYYLDHIVMIDNGSIDGTPDIIRRLQSEGLSCELRIDTRQNHQQHMILTEFIQRTTQEFSATRIVLIDGDEFIDGDKDAVVEELRTSSDVLNIPWKTYVPTPNDDTSERTILSRIGHRREIEDPQYSKASIPQSMCSSIKVGRGSHSVRQNRKRVRGVPARNISFAHFPVRSPQQLVGKILLGSWKIRMRKHSRGEANHWMDLARELQQTPDLSDARFFEIASYYANQSKGTLVFDPQNVKFDETLIEAYREPDVLLRDIVEFTEQLVTQHGYRRNIRQRTGDWVRSVFSGHSRS
ncbi:MAG: glycosyltransferase family 2 protein [Pseudomonadota bacterium]